MRPAPGLGSRPPAVPPDAPPSLAERNRRTAVALLAWIAALVAASVAVAWLRN